MTAKSIVFPCISIGTCICEYILAFEVMVKSGAGAALVSINPMN